MSLPAVVPASGYGSFRTKNGTAFPKVAECVGDRPIIAWIVETVLRAGFSPCIVVVNPLFEKAVRSALTSVPGIEGDVRFVTQSKRQGAADAVRNALPILRELGASSFLVVYGDMPFWRARTMKILASGHVTRNAVLSMISVAREGDYSCQLNWYGRIVRDGMGNVMRVVEWKDASPEELALPDVNPSLFMFDLKWFEEQVGRIPACKRDDGHDSEQFLPPLIGMAYEGQQTIFEQHLDEAVEAVGMNTLDELERARSVFELLNV